MPEQSDVLERLRRVQKILEALRDRDAEFSERLIRHEYETAQEHVLLVKRLDGIEGRRAVVAESPPVSAHPPSLFAEMAESRYGQFVLFSIAVALLAWAGLPVKRWAEGVSVPAIHGGDDDAHPSHEGD